MIRHSFLALLLWLGGCSQDGHSQPTAPSKAETQEAIKREITDRNVGYNVGQNLPWEVSENCFANREDAYYRQLMIDFGEIRGSDRGEYYRISIHDPEVLFGLPDKMPVKGTMALSGTSYPEADGETLRISAWYDLRYNDIIFGVDDTKHQFRDALFKADAITFTWGGKSLSFSMADSTRLRERLRACYGDRFGQIDWS